MKSTDRKAFTLIELMVVIGLLALLMAAFTSSLSGARRRTQIAKAESEVKVVSQAILATENFRMKDGLDPYIGDDQEADYSRLKDLLGQGGNSDTGDKIPATLMAQLRNGQRMMDPWNTPYKISIKKGSASIKYSASTFYSGFFFPNFYRLSAEERK